MENDAKFSKTKIAALAVSLLAISSFYDSFTAQAAATFSDKESCEKHVLAVGSKAMKAPLKSSEQTDILSQLDVLVERCSEGNFESIGVALDGLEVKINASLQ